VGTARWRRWVSWLRRKLLARSKQKSGQLKLPRTMLGYLVRFGPESLLDHINVRAVVVSLVSPVICVGCCKQNGERPYVPEPEENDTFESLHDGKELALECVFACGSVVAIFCWGRIGSCCECPAYFPQRRLLILSAATSFHSIFVSLCPPSTLCSWSQSP
jgi:hypothetical protein